MAYKKQYEKCLSIMKDYNAPNQMVSQFKNVVKAYNHQPDENEIIEEFIHSCMEFDFTCWLGTSEKWFVRKEDVFPKTANEEICYRRGYYQGMCEMMRMEGIVLEQKMKMYSEWRKSAIFKLMTRPGIAEIDKIREKIKY